jgi:general secretion pathway protein A
LHTALRILSEKLVAKNQLRSAFIFMPTMARDEFLEAVLEEFEIPCAGMSKPRRLQALHQMLLETHRRNGAAVLILDEAHLFSPELLEEVRLLSNVDTYGGKLLQIILAGQPEILELLRRRELAALQQRIASRCSLRPLSFVEVRSYIMERLHAAGLREASPFTGPSLEGIHRVTGGVPRLINLVCDTSLTIGFRTQRQMVEPDMVEEAAHSLSLEAVAHPLTAERNTREVPVPESTSSPSFQSAVDLLIQAMKNNRHAARES